MIRSLYSGVIGMKNHQVKLDVVANNIANVNTTGYKASSVSFQDLVSQTIRNASEANSTEPGTNPAQVGIGSQVGSIEAAFTQGAPQYTGRSLDAVIQGNGFFAVEDPNGKMFFTRDGSFRFDNEGYLVNQMGYHVLDTDGDAIEVTETIASVSIDRQGQLTVLDESGTVAAQHKIGVAYILNPESLYKEGNNLYSESTATKYPDGEEAEKGISDAGTEGRGFMEAQALEMSNVDLGTEFASMIITQRGYQANARVITTSDQMLEELINLKR